MYSNKDAANPSYPTQWALNPTAYQNVDTSQVDWAALAQQWIAMKEAATVVAPPPPPMKPENEEGEAPMEVENPDNADGPPGAQWDAATNSWTGGWNQWGWGWSGTGPVDSKVTPDPTLSIAPMIDGYQVPAEAAAPMSGYSTGPIATPTFQHGYWTAPQTEQSNSRSSSRGRERRSKSKTKDHKPNRSTRRDKVSIIPPVIEPIVVPSSLPTMIDAAKRRQLPAWIREGLEKMEREKQRAIEREQEKKAREEAEREKKRLEEEELARIKAEASGQPFMPPKSKFESDSETEEMEDVKEEKPDTNSIKEEPAEDSPKKPDNDDRNLVKKSKEEIMQEVMVAVRRSLTEILLEVTDREIETVSQEELIRYTSQQASRLNAMKATKSKALAAIATGLGLGAYESSSEGSADEDEQKDLSDQQLQEIIRRKRYEFERTSREIDAAVRRAELQEARDDAVATATPPTPNDRRTPRSSVTPPPVDCETAENVSMRRLSKDKRTPHKTIDKSVDKVDGVRKLDSIPEEKHRRPSHNQTPSPNKTYQANSKGASSTSDSDSDSSSSSNTSSGSSEHEPKNSGRGKKRKRDSSNSDDSRKKSKKSKSKNDKKEEKYSKSKYEDYEKRSKSKKDESVKSRDGRGKNREESEERPRKKVKRSRSGSRQSRGGRRKDHSRDLRSHERDSRRDRSRGRDTRRDRSHEREPRRERSRRRDSRRDRSHERDARRDRSYDRSGHKYDRYERSRDRRRSRSGSHASRRR